MKCTAVFVWRDIIVAIVAFRFRIPRYRGGSVSMYVCSY